MASETGTSGSDVLDHSTDSGPGTLIGLGGDDTILSGTGAWTITGDSGADSIVLRPGNTGSITGGTENDTVVSGSQVGSLIIFLNAGADRVDLVNASGSLTIAGGDDSTDAADTILTGGGNDLVFGNGGNDILVVSPDGTDNKPVVGGFGDDSITRSSPGGNDQVFANEGNDTVDVAGGNDTVVAGQGNDSIRHNSATSGGNAVL